MIYLAVGHPQLENFIINHKGLIEKNMNQPVEFCGTAVYREGVLQGVKDTKPDVLLIRESLQGSTPISDLIYNLKLEAPKTRIIFIASDRAPGDAFLASLIGMGIYDLVIGNKVDAKEMLKKIIFPNKFADVAQFAPKPKVDETTNKVLYEAPPIVEQPVPVPVPGVIPTGATIPGQTNFDKDFESAMNPGTTLNPIESLSEQMPEKKKKGGLFGGKKNKTPVAPIPQEVPQKQQKPKKKRGRKNEVTIEQQIVTFVGGSSGVGNSHMAFNTAINLANKNLQVLYLDLNNRNSSIEAMYQLGYEELGIDTAMVAAKDHDLDNVDRAIGQTSKLLQVIDKRDFLYKTYTTLPTNLHFMFFSQLCFDGQTNVREELPAFRSLMQILVKEFKYDIIILDAPANFKNPLTQMAIAYAEKTFFTITQDNAVINNLIKGLRILDDKNVSYRTKSYYIINKFERCNFSEKQIKNLLVGNLEYESFVMNIVPQINKDFVMASYDAMPVTYTTKNKEFKMAMNDIATLIM